MEKVPVKLTVSRAGTGFAQQPGDTAYVTPPEALALIEAGQAEPANPEMLAWLEEVVNKPPRPAPIPGLGAPFSPGSAGETEDDPPAGDPRGGESTDPKAAPETNPESDQGPEPSPGDSGNPAEPGTPPAATAVAAETADAANADAVQGTPLSVLQLHEKAEDRLIANGITTIEDLDGYTADMELENLEGIGPGFAEQIRKARAEYQPPAA